MATQLLDSYSEIAESPAVAPEPLLSPEFQRRNSAKAMVWLAHVPQFAEMLRNGNVGIVTKTGGGKTVMALLIALHTNARTIFLVPTRRLAYRHQMLFRTLGGQLKTRVITGATDSSERIWHDQSDRIIFATGDVLKQEWRTKPHLLRGVHLMVLDEMQYGHSSSNAYVFAAKLAHAATIPILGLSASPGNTPEQTKVVQKNLRIFHLHQVEVPVPKQLVSIIEIEQTSAYVSGKQEEALQVTLAEIGQIQELFNLTAEDLDSELRINASPLKITELSELRKQFVVSPANKQQLSLWSIFEQYAVWCYVYQLITKESFSALLDYNENNLAEKAKSKRYAKAVVESAPFRKLLEIAAHTLHVKLLVLQEVMASLSKRGKKILCFVNNKSTGRGFVEHLNKQGFKCGFMTGSSSMTGKEQDKLLEQMDSGEIDHLVATSVLREGYNLEVDCIINIGQPQNVIDVIQRSGRAGRNQHPAEIVYIASTTEKWQVRRLLKMVDNLDFRTEFGLVPCSDSAAPTATPKQPKGRSRQLEYAGQISFF